MKVFCASKIGFARVGVSGHECTLFRVGAPSSRYAGGGRGGGSGAHELGNNVLDSEPIWTLCILAYSCFFVILSLM